MRRSPGDIATPARYLLRESHREGKKVRKRTLANLSALSDEQIEAIRAVLAGVNLQPAPQWFEILKSLPHGHVQAVRLAMRRLGFESLLATRASAERDRVCAMENCREHGWQVACAYRRAAGVMAEAVKSLPRARVEESIKALIEQDAYGVRAGLASVFAKGPE